MYNKHFKPIIPNNSIKKEKQCSICTSYASKSCLICDFPLCIQCATSFSHYTTLCIGCRYTLELQTITTIPYENLPLYLNNLISPVALRALKSRLQNHNTLNPEDIPMFLSNLWKNIP